MFAKRANRGAVRQSYIKNTLIRHCLLDQKASISEDIAPFTDAWVAVCFVNPQTSSNRHPPRIP